MSIFESQRLIFRVLQASDVSDRYVAWLSDPEVNRYLETRFVTQTHETCRAFVEQMAQDSGSHLFGIFLKTTKEHIGNIKLGFINPHHLTGELSFFIGEKHLWWNGYGREAVKAVTRWGFDVLGLEKIEAGCYDGNLASLRCFIKTGYAVEGYFRGRAVLRGKRVGSFWLGILKTDAISE